MFLIFTKKINARISYIFEFIFKDILHVPFSLTTSEEEFDAFENPKMNYSSLKLNTPFYLRPHPILYEKGLAYQDLKPIEFKQEIYFFKSSKNSFLPFDPFAATFYLITRYEEYLEREFGKHQRYPSKHSILHRNGLLQKPIVNQWAFMVAEKIKEQYPDFQYQKPNYDFLTTIDIDNAWAYKNKSLLRTLGASTKSLLKGDFQHLRERLQVLSGNKPDPYNTYDFFFKTYKDMPDKLRFFVLAGKPGKYDRNVSPKNKRFQELIQKLSATFPIGVHPSYGSVRNRKRLPKEIETLEKITQQKIDSSRQHFLKLILPKTYRTLIKAGINNDYTMGYAEQIGFRAGVATPFFFYDLKKEKQTSLRVFPFQMMDVTMNDYLRFSPEEAMTEIENIMLEIKKYGGTFISLWHNESLSEHGKWAGWKTVFEQMTRLAIKFSNEN